jgi:hypothetical protein
MPSHGSSQKGFQAAILCERRDGFAFFLEEFHQVDIAEISKELEMIIHCRVLSMLYYQKEVPST